MLPERWGRVSPANIDPSLFDHILNVSWQKSVPRSNRRSSTCRKLGGRRTYIITTRITSGDALKRRNGPGGSILDLRFITAR